MAMTSIHRSMRQEMAMTLALFVLVAVPFLLLWRTPWGRGYALMAYFLGSTIAAANFTYRNFVDGGDWSPPGGRFAGDSWWGRLAPLTAAVVLAATVFSLLCLVFREGVEDPVVAPMLAFMAIVPVLGITPYFVLALRQRFAAVVFTVALVGAMKLLGCLVVVLLYGWDADEQGRLGLPWHRPDLLVWLFWSFTTALSAACGLLARRRFDVRFTEARLAEGCPS
jgi:hypothetical protein